VDVPEGFTTTPHQFGSGFLLDKAEVEAHRPQFALDNPTPMLPEAEVIADIYKQMLRGNSIGVSGGMGGMMPEKLLWPTIHAYARQTRTKLSQWVLSLLFTIDGIRLNCEFDRMKRESDKAKQKP